MASRSHFMSHHLDSLAWHRIGNYEIEKLQVTKVPESNSWQKTQSKSRRKKTFHRTIDVINTRNICEKLSIRFVEVAQHFESTAECGWGGKNSKKIHRCKKVSTDNDAEKWIDFINYLYAALFHSSGWILSSISNATICTFQPVKTCKENQKKKFLKESQIIKISSKNLHNKRACELSIISDLINILKIRFESVIVDS